MTTTLTAPALTADQSAALAEISERIRSRDAVATLAGYAGTGKTFTLRTLLHELDSTGWNVLLTAPTHQALAVAGSDLPSGVETMTLHAALGLVVRVRDDGSTETTARTRPKLRGRDLIVVDEASMVGADLYQALMRERECAVLFVGDPGQLPPIGERESPAFADVSHRITLSEIVRQAEGSALIQVAHEIRRIAESGHRVRLDALRPYAERQAQIQSGNLQTVIELVADARAADFETVALTYTNADVDRINAGVHRTLHPDAALPFAPGERVLFRAPYHAEGREDEPPIARTNELATVRDVSEPYLAQQNTPAINLALAFDDGRERSVPTPLNPPAWRRAWGALFAEHRAAKANAKLAPGAEQRRELDELARLASARAWMLRTRFGNLQHAYAMTAHRAQGSTYDIAVLHWQGLAKMRDDFEHARAVYVAATRPRHYLVIVE